MKVYAKPAGHAVELEAAVLKSDAAKLAKAKCLESAFAAETRKAGFAAGLRSSKEAAVRVIKTLQGPALDLARKGCSIGITLPPLGKCLALVEECPAGTAFAISSYALFERGVVELPLIFQYPLQRAMFALRGQKAVAEGEHHLVLKLLANGLTR